MKQMFKELICMLHHIINLMFYNILTMFWSCNLFFNPFKTCKNKNIIDFANHVMPLTSHSIIGTTKNNGKNTTHQHL